MGKKKRANTAVSPSAKPKEVSLETLANAQREIEKSNDMIAAILPQDFVASELPVVDASDSSSSPIDVDKCVGDLKQKIKMLEAAKRKYEDLQAQYELRKKEWQERKLEGEKLLDKAKQEVASERQKLIEEVAQKRRELNARELKLIDDEVAAKSGDHSPIVSRLIDAYKLNRDQLLDIAEVHLSEQTKVTTEYLDRLTQVKGLEVQLSTQKEELRIREKKVKADEILLEEARGELKSELTAELKKEYSEELRRAQADASHYKGRYQSVLNERDQMKEELDTIRFAFGLEDPVLMAGKCTDQKKHIAALEEELFGRPSKEELEAKQQQIDALKQSDAELKEKLNEKELLELRKLLTNSDTLIVEKQIMIGKIESLKARNDNCLRTIEDLRTVIKEINESRNKDNAFKTSSRYDADDYQVPLSKAMAPRNLSELVGYLQGFMASSKNGDKSLRYSTDTIKKFIAGLHMSPISILQGISGTGKTSLPRAIAIAMVSGDDRYGLDNGADELPQAPYRICPIQSGWRDKMDLFGFYNAFEKSYHETEFFNALYLANQPKYRDTLFFIILDEMNLSRPEHYFADFLSKLEQPEAQRRVKLDNVPEDICPKSVNAGMLPIPPNVRFIGTANHDETTLEFAPKTYDRSNVIEMPRNMPEGEIIEFKQRYRISYEWLSKQFAQAEKDQATACAKFEKFISNKVLIELLSERGIGIGNRFEGQGKRFLSVFVASGEDPKGDIAKAVDHLMTMRMLRTLKDNYDLSYDALEEFKTRYVELFKKHFGSEPEDAKWLLDSELKKKQ